MLVSDVMVRDVITCKENEEITKILKKMEDNRIHQLPVVSNGKVLGMVFLKDILRFAYDAKKNTARDFLVKIHGLDTECNLQEAVKNLLRLGVRALPVTEDDELKGIISETDLIKNVEFLEDISPHKLMSGKIFAVRSDGNLGRALAIMSEQNISRVPVVDSLDRVVGCIDNLSLIKFIRLPRESVRFSKLTTLEPASAKKFPTKDYMKDTVTMEVADFSLKNIVDLLQSNEEVLITNDGRLVGIATPRDILELAVIEEEIPIQVARAEKIDAYDKGRLDDTLRRFVKRFDKIIPAQRFFIYIDTHEAEGGRKKYSMRANFITDRAVFRAKSHGWDVWEALHTLLDNTERQILKYKEKAMKVKRSKIKDSMLHTGFVEEV